MAHPNETNHGPETHCELCARDQRRADILSAAAMVVGVEDDSVAFKTLQRAATGVLQKAFDEELLPKGLG